MLRLPFYVFHVGENMSTKQKNLHELHESARTRGQRIADGMARIVGSWPFVIMQSIVLCGWIAFNVYLAIQLGEGKAFDPYPFILLNLVLSCLAAIQAPIIMMSQNRQESKDRLRAENDYKVNLKAELEIRALSEKMDRLLNHQWQRLLEIQQIQTDLMEEVARKSGK